MTKHDMCRDPIVTSDTQMGDISRNISRVHLVVIVSCTFDTMGAIMIIIVIEGLSILSKKSYFGAISIFTKLKDSHFAKEFILLFFIGI